MQFKSLTCVLTIMTYDLFHGNGKNGILRGCLMRFSNAIIKGSKSIKIAQRGRLKWLIN